MSRRSYHGPTIAPDSGVLSERVDGLQADFASFRSEIGAALKGLSDKFDERSRTPWGQIWSAAGVLMTVLVALGGVGVYALNQPVSQLAEGLKQTRLDMADGFKAFADRTVSTKELDLIVQNATARRDDAQRNTDARMARDEAETAGQIAELRDRLKGYVPAEAVALITKQLDDLERRFNASRG